MEVEVVFPQICGAFYKATIVDLQVEEQKALLSFEDNWKPDSWAELDHIRFLPDIPTSSFIKPGSKVEALLPHQDNEPPGWWNGTLLKSKGELHVVEFQSGNEKYQDIVDQDKIRPPNNKEPLSKCQFVSQEYSVPEDLQSFCDKPAIHENFRKRIGAVCVHYSMDKGSLVVQASSEESMDKASLLIDMHLRDLRTHKQLMDRADAVAQREHQQQRRQLDSGVYEQQYTLVQRPGRTGHRSRRAQLNGSGNWTDPVGRV
ncbi:Fragile X mental retardation syndrome-related protein 1 homolog B [Geodia barretti]|uniref:Fragile X mental retardation syndrome-related protein 1 homolog B n=1 Tax=Geodia barretti TaxID=519541 RepID=A0AA35R9K9_GEOBA|nr:Fragile X mental retardation syndrome-related protein 1 homolog B [Geodia barretti]